MEQSRLFLSPSGQGEITRKFAGTFGGVTSAVPVRQAAMMMTTERRKTNATDGSSRLMLYGEREMAVVVPLSPKRRHHRIL
jgi:hypothetical protein